MFCFQTIGGCARRCQDNIIEVEPLAAFSIREKCHANRAVSDLVVRDLHRGPGACSSDIGTGREGSGLIFGFQVADHLAATAANAGRHCVYPVWNACDILVGVNIIVCRARMGRVVGVRRRIAAAGLRVKRPDAVRPVLLLPADGSDLALARCRKGASAGLGLEARIENQIGSLPCAPYAEVRTAADGGGSRNLADLTV